MNLSKSRYCRGLQCKKMLWLEQYKPDVKKEINNDDILEQGNMVHEVARYLFGDNINIKYNDNLNEMIKDTYKVIENNKDIIITEASFNYENNFCSVDILIKKNDIYEIYEVKSSTEVKDNYINDASYQYYVLTNLGFKVNKCSVVVINRDYVRHGDIELDKLFMITDVTDEIIKLQPIIKNNIMDINKYLDNKEEVDKDIDINCFKPYMCPFFDYCTRNIDSNNVFKLAGMHKSTMIKYYKEGLYNFKDLLNTEIDDNYKQQMMYDLGIEKEDYIDKEKLKEFLDSLSYPLYFLDFETYALPIPPYDLMHPYEKIPFQYSLHYILEEDGEVKHSEFLGNPKEDPRRELAESLVRDIPKDCCTLAYNMGFEKGVIKKLASLYPDLREHLLNIYDNIKDLMIPFKYRYYYTKDMHGSYSIKYVLPALYPGDKELDYHNLDLVHNGSEAMNTFTGMINMNDDEIKYVRDNLLKYCYLDTYAMVKIYDKIKQKVR